MKILANTDHSRIAIFGYSRHVIYKMLDGYTTESIKCWCLYEKLTPLLSIHYEFTQIMPQLMPWLMWEPPYPKATFVLMV